MATVGPALPISFPNPYQRIARAIGNADRPPRIGGRIRRSALGFGGFVMDWGFEQLVMMNERGGIKFGSRAVPVRFAPIILGNHWGL